MTNLNREFWLKLALILCSLQLCIVSAQVAPSFDRIYTESVAYSLPGLTPVLQNQECIVVNQAIGQAIACEGGAPCLCGGGVIANLFSNTLYSISFKASSTLQVIASGTVKTAATGTFNWSYGVNSVSYSVNYAASEKAPFSCESSLTTLDVSNPVVYPAESENSCQSGSFLGLPSSTEFSLILTNNGALMHNNEVLTGFFNATVGQVGLTKVEYVVSTNLDASYLEGCIIFDQSSGTPISCLGGPCNCLNGNLTGFSSSTNYTVQFRKGVDILADLSFATASAGTLSVEKAYKTLNYTVSYPAFSQKPSLCVPCLVKSQENVTVDTCKNLIAQLNHVAIFCDNYYYITLDQGILYDSILFDSFLEPIAESRQVKVPSTTINQTSMQLASASYIMETDIPLGLQQPCEFTDDYYYDDKFLCELDNGVKTVDCPCTSGKLVNLHQDAYIYFNVYQNGSKIAEGPKFYTAYHGVLTIESVGLFSMEYSVYYYSLAFPPQNCISCLVPVVAGVKNCDNYNPLNNSEVCNRHTFLNIANGTEYNLLIFDGDLLGHTNFKAFTASFPIDINFAKEKDVINYALTYKKTTDIPTTCKVYFLEDPTYELQCQPSICDCSTGSVILPKENKKLITVVIADQLGEVLAELKISQSKLSNAAIISISIVLIVVLTVAAGLAAYFVLKRR